MSDVRALLAAERQSRRISHPHLHYAKSGMLICTVCNLNVKSEALWEGHLRSANHKRNAHAQSQSQSPSQPVQETSKGVKRKIEAVEEVEEDRFEVEVDARKKTKSLPEHHKPEALPPTVQRKPDLESSEDLQRTTGQAPGHDLDRPQPIKVSQDQPQDSTVDESEWAAFEREVAPLSAPVPDYTGATITAAPVTTAQIEEQAAAEKQRRQAAEGDDEKEEEERRLEDEFDVMEEMEDRVRKLREKREALRLAAPANNDAAPGDNLHPSAPPDAVRPETPESENDHDEDDDWYA